MSSPVPFHPQTDETPAPVAPTLRLVPPLAIPGLLDDDAFDAALGRALPKLTRFAHRRLGNAHEAEEIASEAVMRAHAHRSSLATEDDLMAWTTTVAGRLTIDRLRVRNRSTAVAEVPERGSSPDAADIVIAREQVQLALDALEALPARQAKVLWAREVEGMSYEAIAERYALTESSVRSLLLRGRRALRREFADRGGSVPRGTVTALIVPALLIAISRLRRLATTAAPSAMAAFVVGVGLFALPYASPAARPDTRTLATAPMRGTAAEKTTGTTATTSTATTAKSAAKSVVITATRGTAATAGTPTSTSTSTTSTGAVDLAASGCAALGPSTGPAVTCGQGPDPTPTKYAVHLPVTDTAGIIPSQVGVGLGAASCTSLPTTPIAGCTSGASTPAPAVTIDDSDLGTVLNKVLTTVGIGS